jgi:hypothetical protein
VPIWTGWQQAQVADAVISLPNGAVLHVFNEKFSL